MKLVRRRLGDIAQIIGGATPSTKISEYWDGGIPWITPKDLSGFEGIYIDHGSRNISQSGLEHSSAKMLPIGSVLYTSRAPIGYVAIATVPVTTNQGFKSLILNDGYVPEYIYYLLKFSKSEIESYSSGGTFAEISAKALGEVELDFPDERHQRAIAEVLLNLDRKIQAHQNISQSLEEIAQTIFKSWFIDFDPVKAKMAGEKPVGMDEATASMFPDSMEDSELGPIPAGWSVQDFGDVNHLLMGQSPPGDTYNTVGEGVPFYQGRTDFGMRFPKQRVFCTAGTRFAKTGEVLISVRAPVGDLNQAIEDCVIGRGVASALHKSASQVYSYALLSSLRPKLAYYNGEGSVFGAINRSDFNSLKVVEPLRKVIDLFDTVTSAFNDEIRNLFVKTESLTQMRDSLLPRFISGELQIPKEMLAS